MFKEPEEADSSRRNVSILNENNKKCIQFQNTGE